MNNLIAKVLELFLWPSTWKGLVAILTAAGVTLSPDQSDKIIAAGLALIGAIQVFVDDHTKTKEVK